MGKKELYISIPSFFKCPISLDIMKSPVSLSTGITYDRINIQRWFDAGNTTCPATMQIIHSKDLIPNITLRRLIDIWSINQHRNFHSVSSGEVYRLIHRVLDEFDRGSSEHLLECFVKILCFTSESLENVKVIASNDIFVMKLVEILASDGPDLDPDLLEAVLKLFEVVTSAIEYKQKHKLLLFQTNPNLIQNLAKILNSTRSESRVIVTRILEKTAIDQESKKLVFDNINILSQFLDILNIHDSHQGVVVEAELDAVLSCLISLTSPRRNKIKLIEAGGATILTNLITKTSNNTHKITEHLLTLLEMLVGCIEGRTAITNNVNCIPAIISTLMKVSKVANEHGIALLWSLCYFFRDQKAKEMMIRSNGGLTKILLMMQGDCSPAIKRMCCDLLRIFKVFSKSCLSSYDTKNTHIMPC